MIKKNQQAHLRD